MIPLKKKIDLLCQVCYLPVISAFEAKVGG